MVGFIGPSYTLRSSNVDCQRCVNMYPEVNELGTGKEREVVALIGTPGLKLALNLGVQPVRGLYTTSTGRLYAVCGNKLMRIESTGNVITVGTIGSTSGVVQMADNGTNLILVDGGAAYNHVIGSGTTSTLVSAGWMGSNVVGYVDGYFIFVKPNSQRFYISGLYDTTLDPLDFASVEGSPDNIVAMVVDHRELWMLGENTTEIFYNSGNADFPFERIQGAFIEVGCAARNSVAKLNNTVFWLARDANGRGMVVAATGYQPQRISNHAVELAIQSYGTISDAVAYTYQQDGHSFYAISFTAANVTWVYDVITNMWHERAYTNPSNGQFERHRANCHAFAYNKHYVGDYANGNVYELKMDQYTDNGDSIVRMRTAPHSTQDMKRIFYSDVQLDMETGNGLDGTQQGTDPQVMLQWSDDGGHTWSIERWVGSGKIGEYKRRVLWRRLGQARDRVFRVKISDPVKVVLIGMNYDASSGHS